MRPRGNMSVRGRVAMRLLPFVFLLYLINFIDPVNVYFAAPRMKADLGFSDRVYDLGASFFFLTYMLFEIPGAVLVERWSARKWIVHIMVSWGLVTVLTAFIHTAQQFYAARLFLGAAEASFYPGIIVYLTHWFTHDGSQRNVLPDGLGKTCRQLKFERGKVPRFLSIPNCVRTGARRSASHRDDVHCHGPV